MKPNHLKPLIIILVILQAMISLRSFGQSYTLSPSGIVCTSTVNVTMSGSQSGVTYTLNGNGSQFEGTKAGTGSAITWTSVPTYTGGTYWVTQPSGGGTITVATTTINYETTVAGGTVTTPNGTVLPCNGGTINLTVQPTTPGTDYTYQWFYNGAPQSYSNVQTYPVSQPGSYFAVIHNTCSGAQLSPVTITAAASISNLSAISGSTVVAGGTATSTYTATATNATGYKWTLQPTYAGTITGTTSGNTATGTVTWNVAYGGVATITLTATGCNNSSAQDSYTISYNSKNWDYNYVQETDVRTPNITTVAGLVGLPIGQVDITYNYFDGLGRQMQTVMQGASGTGKDIVTPIAYDPLGRQAYKYLPYSTSTGSAGNYRFSALTSSTDYPGGDQYAFYQTNSSDHVNTTDPLQQTLFEASPLSRVTNQGAPGVNWQISVGHSIRPVYTFNNNISWSTNPSTSMQVALYTATINSDGSRTLARAGSNTATYNPNQLSVTVTEDENYTLSMGRAGTTEEYKDILGHTVLKRSYNLVSGTVQVLSTYYVYDIDGDLAFVLTPLSGADGTTAIAQTTLDNLCYQYRYDERNRLTQKKLPGKGWEYTVYNQLDQPVLNQDANQRVNNQWTVTKYDALARVIMTGLWNAGSVIPLTTLQASIYAGAQFDARDYTGNYPSYPTGYVITSYPATLNTTLTINYYDNYLHIPNLPAGYTGPTGYSNMVTSQLTASLTDVLGTNNMLWTVNYYDGLGRNIQTYKQHYLGGILSASNYDVLTTTYDFSNAPTTVTRQHYNTLNTSPPLVTIANRYIYDQEGRKQKNWEQITNGTTPTTRTLLSLIGYNEIGQMLNKQLHSTDSVHFLQLINYTYNERGWLSSSVAPLFQELLAYDTNLLSTGGFVPQYNGNISTLSWGTQTSPNAIASVYLYDNINRLTSGNNTAGNTENNISYDVMGNLKAMYRYQGSANTLIDNLTYTYTDVNGNMTNQVQTVTDGSGNINGLPEGTTSYTYDANGNELSATNTSYTVANKNLTYNLLNLPNTATTPSASVTYTYDADGDKLRKVSTTEGTTDYIDGIQYLNGSIQFIQTEEGRELNTSGGYYEYNLTDHLGSERVSFSTLGGTVTKSQQDDYYPFGLQISIVPNSPESKYLYNKKELQDELTDYDYGARFYDPVIARWTSMDPLAETSAKWSVYNYGEDNPIGNVDIGGMYNSRWMFGGGNEDPDHYGDPIEQEIVNSGNICNCIAGPGDKGKGGGGKNSGKTSTIVPGPNGQGSHDTHLIPYLPPPDANTINAGMLSAEVEIKDHRSFWSYPGSGDYGFSNAELDHDAAVIGWIAGGEAIGGFVGPAFSWGKGLFSSSEIGTDITSGFRSFSAFKRFYGAADEGFAWHHIVEQTPGNIERFGSEMIHSPENLMQLEHGAGSIHARISGFYSSIQPFTDGVTVRRWLSTQTFEQQFNYGIDKLIEFGWKP